MPRRAGHHGLAASHGPFGGSRLDLVQDLVYCFTMVKRLRPPRVVNVHDAKTHFSRLLRRVAAGEEIVIARAGRPVARLVAIGKPATRRRPGTGVGEIVIRDDFDAPLPEKTIADFEDEGKAR